MLKPLKLDSVREKRAGGLRVRFPAAEEERADRAVAMVRPLIPVVESYLDAPLTGGLQLDLLEEARAGGANAATGVVRHALRGFDVPSPRTAGLLSYQIGQVLWYRTTGGPDYSGASPRSPDWLVEAALLPLLHVWSDRRTWLDYLAEQIALFAWHRPLPAEALVEMRTLKPRQRSVASAQCLLRGQSLLRRHPDWVRDLRAILAERGDLDGLGALAALTGAPIPVWEERFAADLADWRRSADDPDVLAPGGS